MNTLDPQSGQGTGAHVEFTGGGVMKDDMGGVGERSKEYSLHCLIQ